MKKEQIIECAKELFVKYGYKKVSMSEIAREANVTKRTLYSYFKDKEELLNYFMIEEIKNMKDIIEVVEKEELPFLKKVHKVLYSLLEYKKQSNFLITITKESERGQLIFLKESLKMLDKPVKEYIKNKLVYAIEQGYVKKCNIDITTFLIYKIYVALMFEWDEEKEPLDDKEISDSVLNILKTGLLNEEEEK